MYYHVQGYRKDIKSRALAEAGGWKKKAIHELTEGKRVRHMQTSKARERQTCEKTERAIRSKEEKSEDGLTVFP